MPITSAVFSADSDDIRSRFLKNGGRDDDQGGIGWIGSKYFVGVVVDVVVEDVVIIPKVVLKVFVVSWVVEIVSGVRDGLVSAAVLLPHVVSSGVVPEIIVVPKVKVILFKSPSRF